MPAIGGFGRSASPSARQQTNDNTPDACRDHAPIASTSQTTIEDLNNAERRSPVEITSDGEKQKQTGGIRGTVSNMLQQNPYFSAGFGLMGVGAALAILRKSAVQAAYLGRRRLLVSLEISSKDPSYIWFLQWMSAHSAKQSAMSGLAGRIRSHELAVETVKEQRSDGSTHTSFSLVPGPGTHFFKFNKAWFQLKRERDGKMMDLTTGTPFETVTLTALSKDRSLFRELLEEAQELAKESQQGKIVIYTAWGPEWRPFGQPRSRRLLDSVVLDQGVKERILKDVTDFMERGKWYAERGIPYRRGILLHGPPGSGKSSFIQALAGSLEYNICVLNLSERGLTDDKLNHLLVNAPERSFILLEDIDAAFSGRQQADEHGFSGNVTFSGLLNALDGVASSTSQRILFMTTNHIDRLDPALIRPGRVDLKELLDDTSAYQARTLFSRFYNGSLPGEDLQELSRQLESMLEKSKQAGQSVSMAALQGHFIRNDAATAVASWPELVDNVSMDKRVTGEMRKFVAASSA